MYLSFAYGACNGSALCPICVLSAKVLCRNTAIYNVLIAHRPAYCMSIQF